MACVYVTNSKKNGNFYEMFTVSNGNFAILVKWAQNMPVSFWGILAKTAIAHVPNM